MRKRFFSSSSLGGLVAAAKRDVSASGFSDYANNIWQQITRIPDVKTPNLQTLVATFRCDAIVREKLDRLSAAKLDKGSLMGPKDFAKKFLSSMEICFSEYDEETKYYDEGIRSDRRADLVSRAHEVLLMHLSTSFAKSQELHQTTVEVAAAAQVAGLVWTVVMSIPGCN